MKKQTYNKKNKTPVSARTFKKSLVSYVLMLIFFGFLFLRVGVSWFVFFMVAIPMTISIIHKYIDSNAHEEDAPYNNEDIYTNHEPYDEEEPTESPLDLEEFKSLRKEWKDSDFV